MIVIACVDNTMGMLFNKRRQSKDIKVIEHIINGFGRRVGNKFFVDSYSETLFKGIPYFIYEVNENALDVAGEDDVCFIEKQHISRYLNDINAVVLYKWNRNYPSDKYFDLDLTQYRRVSVREFMGKSHDKITEEIYVKL